MPIRFAKSLGTPSDASRLSRAVLLDVKEAVKEAVLVESRRTWHIVATTMTLPLRDMGTENVGDIIGTVTMFCVLALRIQLLE